MTDKVIFFLASQSWTVPSDWNNAANTIEWLDAGYDGLNPQASPNGGKGGDYTKYTNVSLTKGASIAVVVGQHGSASSLAFSGGTGPTTNSGGAGHTDVSPNMGWGGGAAGPSSPGGLATEGTAGAAASGSWTSTHNPSGGVSVLGAAPGAGGTPSVNGAAYGGGGGWLDDIEAGSHATSGADGIVIVTYTPQPAVTGTLAATEARDTFAGSGTVGSTGTLAATEARDTFAAAGAVSAGAVTGALAATEAADTFAGSGTVVTGIGGTLAATEARDTFAGAGSVLDATTSGAGGGGGGSSAEWEFVRQVKIQRAARQKVRDLAAPAILDVAEEARKAALLEKAKVERQGKIKEQMRLDAVKETARQDKARAQAERAAEEERKSRARALTDALDPQAVAKEHRRQRQVAANHDHHREMGRKIEDLAGAVLTHLATTPRQK